MAVPRTVGLGSARALIPSPRVGRAIGETTSPYFFNLRVVKMSDHPEHAFMPGKFDQDQDAFVVAGTTEEAGHYFYDSFEVQRVGGDAVSFTVGAFGPGGFVPLPGGLVEWQSRAAPLGGPPEEHAGTVRVGPLGRAVVTLGGLPSDANGVGVVYLYAQLRMAGRLVARLGTSDRNFVPYVIHSA